MNARTAIAVLAAGLVTLTAGATAATSASAESGLIAFARKTGTGVGELYVVRPDGTGLRRLSTVKADHDPAWTPDGKRLVFASSRGGRAGAPELYATDQRLGASIRLTRTKNSVRRWFASYEPAVSPDGRKLAFVRLTVDAQSSVDVWVADSTGRNERQLTNGRGAESSPTWSADGRVGYSRGPWILVRTLEQATERRLVRGGEPAWSADGRSLAFTRDGGVFVAAADGSDARRVARGSSPALSPDASRVVYSSQGGLFTVKRDGTDRRRLTRAPGLAHDLSPAWQPVAATRSLAAAAPDAIVYGHRGEIYVRQANGTVRRLTRNSVFDGFPSWSPDRTKIVFTREVRDDSDVFVMAADGTGVRRLAGSRKPGHDLYPAWSPDGRLIAFASDRPAEREIYVMRAGGSGPRRLTRTKPYVDDTQPRFSPDGRFVLFTSNRVAFSNYELFRVRVSDGGGVKRLTFWGSGGDGAPGDDVSGDFSPDGKQIAFVSDRNGGYAIWTMRADGKGMREVARHRGMNVVFPRFSPDGGTLIYTLFDPTEAKPRFELWTVRVDGSGRVRLGPGSEADW